MPERRKVSVIGAGGVGATIAYASLIRGAPKTVALYDIDPDKVRAEVLDLNHGSQFYPTAAVIGSDDIAVTGDSDIVVITAGAKQKPGQTRLELAAVNVSMCRSLVPALLELSPDAILLLVTNPVDIVTYAAVQASGLPSRRVFGSGTVLDSSRLRTLLAQHCDVAVHSVNAFIVGEHGDSQVAAWSQAAIGGVPVREWSVAGRPPLDERALDQIAQEVVTAAEQIIRGKGATNFAVGLATAGIVEAVLHDERSVLPVSSLLSGQYGIDDVCLSLPSIVDAKGVDAVLTPPLTEAEVAALRRSAETVRGVERSLGI
jgi:L-lactate dehydrogenase